MTTATAMLAETEVMIPYYVRAMRYLQDEGRDLHQVRHEEIEKLAQSLRYEEFRRTIDPLERFRNKPVHDWLSLQCNLSVEQPEWLKKNTQMWNEEIIRVARQFGYSTTQGEIR